MGVGRDAPGEIGKRKSRIFTESGYIKYAAIVKFQNAGLLCAGGGGSEHVEGRSRSLGLSRTGPLVAVHHAGPDLCPTLQGANIALSSAIQAGYQLQVHHIKLPAVPKALMKPGSEYRNKLQRDTVLRECVAMLPSAAACVAAFVQRSKHQCMWRSDAGPQGIG